MRCTVLGAGGFIGLNLCQALVSQGHFVLAFGRQACAPLALNGCEWRQGDFFDEANVKSAVDGSDVVFHLVTATTPASANADMLTDLRGNVESTIKMLDACRTTNVRRVVFVSSGGTVYGIPQQVPTPESAPTNPISAYGISKLAIEKYLGLYEYLYDLEYRVLRVANPFGPYQLAKRDQGAIAAFLHQALQAKPIKIWGDGSVVRDYIYIGDVVTAMLLAATHNGPERIFNIGSSQGRSLNEIAASINILAGGNVVVEYQPGRAVDVPVSILDTSISADKLDWRPSTNFEDGLNLTIDWMRTLKQ